jgi:hypothetical protein
MPSSQLQSVGQSTHSSFEGATKALLHAIMSLEDLHECCMTQPRQFYCSQLVNSWQCANCNVDVDAQVPSNDGSHSL